MGKTQEFPTDVIDKKSCQVSLPDPGAGSPLAEDIVEQVAAKAGVKLIARIPELASIWATPNLPASTTSSVRRKGSATL